MEYLIQFIDSLLRDPDYTRGVILLIIAVTVILATISLGFIIVGIMNPIRKRLMSIANEKDKEREAKGSFNRMAESAQPLTMPKKAQETQQTQLNLIRAGYRSQSALSTFYAIKLLLGLILPGMVLFGATIYPHFSTTQVVFSALFAALLGSQLPTYILQYKLKKRQKEILHGFPDALDLLVSCTEAGLGLNSALQRVADEMDVSCPELAEELSQVNAEIRAGVDRVQAMRGLYERTGLDDLRGLVSLFSQTMRFGTSIADALRMYAEEFRDKRMQRAEEQAAKLATKMIFPMVLCIFPAFFVVAIGPAVLKLMNAFQNMGGN